jgi:hypothetical protein
METKKKISKEERERILTNIRKSAIRYQETNRILDEILPEIQDNNYLGKTL